MPELQGAQLRASITTAALDQYEEQFSKYNDDGAWWICKHVVLDLIWLCQYQARVINNLQNNRDPYAIESGEAPGGG